MKHTMKVCSMLFARIVVLALVAGPALSLRAKMDGGGPGYKKKKASSPPPAPSFG